MLSIVLMSESPIVAIKMGKGKEYKEFDLENSPYIKYLNESKIIITINDKVE